MEQFLNVENERLFYQKTGNSINYTAGSFLGQDFFGPIRFPGRIFFGPDFHPWPIRNNCECLYGLLDYFVQTMLLCKITGLMHKGLQPHINGCILLTIIRYTYVRKISVIFFEIS